MTNDLTASDNKIIANNSLILFIRLFVVSIVGLVTSRYILRALGASDYGLYAVVGGIVIIVSFLNNIMISTTYRFIAFELGKGKEGNVNEIFNVSIVLHSIIALITLVIAETIGVYYIKNYLNVPKESILSALHVFQLSTISAIVTIISIPFQGLIIAKEKFHISAFIEIVRSFISLIVVIIIPHYAGNKLELYALLMFLINSVPAIMYIIFVRINYISYAKWKYQKELSKYKEMLSFGIWILYGAIAAAAEFQLSAIMINLFFGTVVNAAFGISNQINAIFIMFAQSINSAFVPQITKSYSGGNIARSMQLVIASSKYSFFVLMLITIPLLLETEQVIVIWLKDVPEFTVIFIKLILINSLISIMNAGIPAAIQATGKIKLVTRITATITIIGLPISYYFLKRGMPPYILPIIYLTIRIFKLFIDQFVFFKIIKLDVVSFIKQAYLKMFYALLPVLPLFIIINLFAPTIYRLIAFSMIATMIAIMSIYLFGLNIYERKSILLFVCNKMRLTHHANKI